MLESFKTAMANQYFKFKMKKIFVNRSCNKEIESFETFLSYGYIDCDLDYSLFALMGLDNDACIIGAISKHYYYNWVEFKFLGNEYVFYPRHETIIPKESFYKSINPKINWSFSKETIYNSFCLKTVVEGKHYIIKKLYNKDSSISDVFENSEIFLFKNKIIKFIGYREPEG